MNIKTAQKNDEKGFTLVELLIVIVILGILATIVVFSVQGLTNKANVNSCDIDLRSMKTAVEAFKADTGSYPIDEPALLGGFLESPSAKFDFAYVDSSAAARRTTGPFYTYEDDACGVVDATVP